MLTLADLTRSSARRTPLKRQFRFCASTKLRPRHQAGESDGIRILQIGVDGFDADSR